MLRPRGKRECDGASERPQKVSTAEGSVGQVEDWAEMRLQSGRVRARLCLEGRGEPMTVKQQSDGRFRKFPLTAMWSRCNSFLKTILDKKENKSLPWLPNSSVGPEGFHHSLGQRSPPTSGPQNAQQPFQGWGPHPRDVCGSQDC